MEKKRRDGSPQSGGTQGCVSQNFLGNQKNGRTQLGFSGENKKGRDSGFNVPEDAPILVVDDDPTLRKAVSRILRHRGHRVVEAQDGPTALEQTRQHQPSLVVLDYSMPGMDGKNVIDAMREEHAEAAPPAVLLTASGKHRNAAELGAVQGLGKPFKVDELLQAVAAHRRVYRRD